MVNLSKKIRCFILCLLTCSLNALFGCSTSAQKGTSFQADLVITATGTSGVWQNHISKDKLALSIDGNLEYLWDYAKNEVIWRGDKHYWRMALNKQDDTVERFWSLLEIEQIITFPKENCTIKAQGEQVLDRQCFGYLLTNLPVRSESKIWDMLAAVNFPEQKSVCGWSSIKLGQLAQQTVSNPQFDAWIKKPRRTLFLHPLMLFMDYSAGIKEGLDRLRPLGANTLTVYSNTHEGCLNDLGPKVTVETSSQNDSMFKMPEPGQIQEFKAEDMFD